MMNPIQGSNGSGPIPLPTRIPRGVRVVLRCVRASASRVVSTTYGIVGLLVAGCHSGRDTATGVANATILSPAVVSYGSVYGLNDVRQTSLISVEANPATFSEEITRHQLQELAQGRDASGLRVVPEWRYLGSKDGYHYLACLQGFDLRRVYRIKQTECPMESTFELTGVPSAWRAFHPLAPSIPPGNSEANGSPGTNPVVMGTNFHPVPFGYRVER